MTAPAAVPPPLNAPLMTLEELAVWVQEPEIPAEKQALAWKAIEGASVVIREKGSDWWCPPETPDPLPLGWIKIPYRAKLLLDLKVKNFYEHPTGAVSETTGPLSERYLDDVVRQFELSDAEERLLAQLASEGGDPAAPVVLQGIWALSTFRGPMETHPGGVRGIVHAPYWREYGQAVPYFVEDAFGSPAPDSPGVIGYMP